MNGTDPTADRVLILGGGGLAGVAGEGRGRGMTDLSLNDIAHLLPRLQQQVGPVRGPDTRGFVHATAQRKT